MIKSLSWRKISYTLAMLGIGLCSTSVVQWLLFYYAPPVELEMKIYLGATAFGTAMALGRLVDAGVDPLIGYYSDKAYSIFGRRKPFMAAGLPVFVISFIMLWFPPSPAPSLLNLLWVGSFLCFFFISLSSFAVPYLALLPEIARSDRERVFLALLQSLWFVIGAGIAVIAPPFLAGLLQFPYLAVLWAAIGILAMSIPLFTFKEETRSIPSSHKTPSSREVFLAMRRNRPFFAWAVALFFIWSGFSVLVMLIPYFSFAFLGIHLENISWWVILIMVCIALLSLFGAFEAVTIYGKRATYLYCLLASAVLVLFIANIGFPFMPGTPEIQFFALTLVALPPMIVPLVLQNAITAEIADLHHHREGQHQEALFFAAQGLAVKFALAMAAISLGFILDIIGYSLERPAGIRAGCILASIYLFLAAIFIRKYPR